MNRLATKTWKHGENTDSDMIDAMLGEIPNDDIAVSPKKKKVKSSPKKQVDANSDDDSLYQALEKERASHAKVKS